MNAKNIIIGIVAFIIILGGLYFVYQAVNGPSTPPQNIDFNVVRPKDNVKWNTKSKNILIEYSDLQCPACLNFYDFFKSFEKTATPNATFVYRYFPLFQIHQNAFAAAYAAAAAADQGKFWPMEEALFDKQSEWADLQDPTSYFLNVAKKIGLNLEKFKSDMGSQAVKDRVQSDLSEGEAIGVNATPTFFLNGKQLTITNLDDFKKLLFSL